MVSFINLDIYELAALK